MEQLLTPKTLAAALGLAEQTIYNRHSTGGNLPPAIKVGRLLRFRPTDFEAWLERQQHPLPSSTVSCVQSETNAPRRRRGRPTKAEEIAAKRPH